MQNKTTVWFVIGFLVLLTAGVIVAGIYSSNSASSTATNNSSGFVATTAPPITAADWKEGDIGSPVVLTEYGDFQCPACGAYFPLMQQLLQDYGNKVEFVFRNFPLSQHQDAQIAAQAAEAAGVLGKYWQMHDVLYENQNTWSTVAPTDVVSQYFNGYAKQLGLNVTQFDAEINATSVLQKIQNDIAGGDAAQINHTPTFFINNVQIPNPNSYADFESALNAALASSTASSSSSSAQSPSSGASTPLTVTSTPVTNP